MSFQEFASKLFGGRDELEERVKASRKVKNADTGGPFSGPNLEDVVNDETIKKNTQLDRVKEEFSNSKDDEVTGFVPEWLAEKKLNNQSKKEQIIKNKGVVSGNIEAETDDAVMIEDEGFGLSSTDSGTAWIPKSQFDEFDSSGPELSNSKREKAEDIMESRSKRARRTDKRNAAPIADSFEEWKSDPSETDLPGIDTLGSGDDFDDLF